MKGSRRHRALWTAIFVMGLTLAAPLAPALMSTRPICSPTGGSAIPCNGRSKATRCAPGPQRGFGRVSGNAYSDACRLKPTLSRQSRGRVLAAVSVAIVRAAITSGTWG